MANLDALLRWDPFRQRHEAPKLGLFLQTLTPEIASSLGSRRERAASRSATWPEAVRVHGPDWRPVT